MFNNHSSVSIAEQILQLTQIHFNESSPDVDPLAMYNAKNNIQDLCNKLLQTVLGRLEYTTLLAGQNHFISLPVTKLTLKPKNHVRRVPL